MGVFGFVAGLGVGVEEGIEVPVVALAFSFEGGDELVPGRAGLRGRAVGLLAGDVVVAVFGFGEVFVFVVVGPASLAEEDHLIAHGGEGAHGFFDFFEGAGLFGDVEAEEMRRIQQRLQVLERITVEKENTLSREIEDLRAAG